MPLTRRQFINSLTATTLTSSALLHAAVQSGERLPIAFSTLGCPKWDWKTVLARAAEWGFAAIELRGLQGQMDLTKCPEFQGARLAVSLKDLEALGLRVCNLGASTRLHEPDPGIRAAQLDEGKRFVDLAQRLQVPYIRVFGDKLVPNEPQPVTIERIVSGLRELGRHAAGSGVAVLIESHGDFCDSASLSLILRQAAMPNVGLLWDAHHTVVVGKEAPGKTLQELRPYIHHVHLKDSKPDGKGVRYVLTGAGTIPLRDTIRLLREAQYQGYYSLEWEKAWHPEIEDPEIAFPQFAKYMRAAADL